MVANQTKVAFALHLFEVKFQLRGRVRRLNNIKIKREELKKLATINKMRLTNLTRFSLACFYVWKAA